MKIISRQSNKSLADNKPINFRFKRRLRIERIIKLLLILSGIITVSVLASTIIIIIIYASPILIRVNGLIEIMTTNNWNTSDKKGQGSYGTLAMIYGTFIVGIPALLLAIVWGVSSAIVLSEYTPERISRMIQPLVEFIAAIPSVIFGLIAFLYISEFIKNIFNVPSGRNILTASLTLSFMATPLIISISLDAMKSTSKDQINAAKALGATRFEILRNIVLPYSKNSIAASVFLAFGRVIGETMVVLIVLGNSPSITWNIFDPAYTLTSAIANELGDAAFGSDEFSALFVLALILLIISSITVYISNLIVNESPKLKSLVSYILKPLAIIFQQLRKLRINYRETKIELSNRQIIRRMRTRKLINSFFKYFTLIILISYLSVIFSLLIRITKQGYSSLNLNFYLTWPTYSTLKAGQYGIYSAIIGSFYLIIFAGLISIPISTATAIYLQEFAVNNRFTNSIKMSIINISSLPSIIVGIFVYGTFSIGLHWDRGVLPGSIALGIMMMPIITTNTIESLKNVPDKHMISAIALGSNRWEAFRKHKLPYSLPSIITGYMLAIARVIGETAPLLFIAADFVYSSNPYPDRLIKEAIRVLPYEIYYNMLFNPNKNAVVWATSIAIALLGFIIILNIIAYFLRNLFRRRYYYNGQI